MRGRGSDRLIRSFKKSPLSVVIYFSSSFSLSFFGNYEIERDKKRKNGSREENEKELENLLGGA